MFDKSVDMTNKGGSNYVVFYHKPLQNKRETKKQGKPVFEEKLYVRIMVPGGKHQVERLAEESDKDKYHDQYTRFVNQQEQVPDGVPIEELTPLIGATACANLRASNLLTVEALADCPDARLPERGGHDYKRQAQAFLEVRDGSGADKISALQVELEEKDNKIKSLQSDIEYLKRRMEELDSGADSATTGGHGGDGGGADRPSNNRRKRKSGGKAPTEGSE